MNSSSSSSSNSDYDRMICDQVEKKLSSSCGGLTGSSVPGEGTGGTHTAHGFLRLFYAQFRLEAAIRAADPNDYRLASLASDNARSFLDIGCATGMVSGDVMRHWHCAVQFCLYIE